jgi:hypothetical protein
MARFPLWRTGNPTEQTGNETVFYIGSHRVVKFS